jgi:hypothetical protein
VEGSSVAREHTDITKIFGIFFQAIPRSIFPDKPLNFSTEMTGWVYPENVLMGVTANFGFINEFILYFGELGVILAGIFIGLVFIWSYRAYIKSRSSSVSCIKYGLIVWPYFGSFVAGYFNDFGLPTLILNIIFFRIAIYFNAIRVR